MSPESRRGFIASIARGRAGKRCNILFVSSDQHANRCLGYMGHPIVQTPNLDRISREVATFVNASCGSPVCVPALARQARAMISKLRGKRTLDTDGYKESGA